MSSIASRLLVGTGLVLTIFVLLVGLSVSWSVHQRAQTAHVDSLRGLVYGILGATEIESNTRLRVNSQALPDLRLNHPSSGLFAELIGSDGQVLWQSESVTTALPQTVIRPIGDWYFDSVDSPNQSISIDPMSRLQLSTAWEFDNGEELPFIVHVVDQAQGLNRQLERFDRTLWASLLGSAAALLIIQILVLRYSLKPLLNIGQEVASIEKGEQDELTETVPLELEGLTSGLNALLRSERQRHAQYRHLLGDLSHSLKTPLSVLRNLASSSSDHATSETILEQTELMQTSLKRYSQRASHRGPRFLAPNIPVLEIAQRMVQSLSKLFQEPTVEFELSIDQSFYIRMDEADLLEILGNVLENSCKYGATSVHIGADSKQGIVIVDDNGPGFPPGDLQRFKERGVRADTQTPGTGMGLAAAQQILGNYGGSLALDHSPLGGARVVIHLA
ncbi:MAG: hypothetical protein KTR32_16340 [Granulosicoccus sp.]|nr:hypothetical protein [Granulosicoccus sp.]